MTGFVLGAGSRKKLQGVHPKIISVVERAIAITKQDFSVHDGVRTLEQQRALVRAGASQTMNSMHRRQDDSFGHAVDLVPFINGQMRWEWGPIYEIATAVRIACEEQHVPLRWGGCWRPILEIHPTPLDMRKAVEAYGAERRKAGKKAFTDGPHFELPV